MRASIQTAINNWTQTHSSPTSGKAYFSYDEKTGWKVEDFNLFWRIIRRVFGVYASTHLKTVQSKYGKLPENERVNLELIRNHPSLRAAYISSIYTIDGESAEHAVNVSLTEHDTASANYHISRLKAFANFPRDTLLSETGLRNYTKIGTLFIRRMTALNYHNTAQDCCVGILSAIYKSPSLADNIRVNPIKITMNQLANELRERARV